MSIQHHVCSSSINSQYRGTRLYLKPGVFWEPALPGFEGTQVPIYCFLVSHGDRHVIFDLGVRMDWDTALPPKIIQLVQNTTVVSSCTKDVVSVLDEDNSGLNIRSTDIEAVIWSHNHFDHTGDPSRFPPHTELIVGPGVTGTLWPGYPSNPDSGVLDSDAANRNVREIRFQDTDTALKIGEFDAFDYFGDGSFYLLDAPGHAPGHMCGLARTTADPPSFVFMGADACHNAGVLRPSQYIHLPQPSSTSQVCSYGGCPGDIIMHLASWKGVDEPFFQVARGPLFHDHGAAMKTVSKIQGMDADCSLLVLLAHDESLDEHLPLFPERVNDWLAQNLGDDSRWAFCKEFKDMKPL